MKKMGPRLILKEKRVNSKTGGVTPVVNIFIRLWKSIKNKLEPYQLEIEIIGIVIAISSVWFSYHLSTQESLERYKQLEPAVLNVTHWVNISDPQDKFLFINIKNVAKFKATGNLSIYRIETNPYRPAILLPSLNAGENTTIQLGINYSIATYPIEFGEFLFEDWYVRNVTIPAYKLYYITEHTSISYRIACDNCNSEGIVRRFPEFGTSEPIIRVSKTTMQLALPIYSWIDFSLDDLKGR